jgi:hypothetical protein
VTMPVVIADDGARSLAQTRDLDRTEAGVPVRIVRRLAPPQRLTIVNDAIPCTAPTPA